MLPSLLRVAFRAMKTLAPTKAFNSLVDDFAHTSQMYLPLTNIKVDKISDREATITVDNCPARKRMRALIEKTGLDVDPVELCALEGRMFRELAKDLGVDLEAQVQKDGCLLRAILK